MPKCFLTFNIHFHILKEWDAFILLGRVSKILTLILNTYMYIHKYIPIIIKRQVGEHILWECS